MWKIAWEQFDIEMSGWGGAKICSSGKRKDGVHTYYSPEYVCQDYYPHMTRDEIGTRSVTA